MLKNDIFPSQFPRARTAAPPLSGGLMWRAAAVKLNWPTEGDSCKHTSFSRSQTLKVRSFPTDRRRLSEKESFRIHDLIFELVCKVFKWFHHLAKTPFWKWMSCVRPGWPCVWLPSRSMTTLHVLRPGASNPSGWPRPGVQQVWSLTQFYSVSFSQSMIREYGFSSPLQSNVPHKNKLKN